MVTRLFIYLLLLGGAAVAGGDRLQELSQQARQAQAAHDYAGAAAAYREMLRMVPDEAGLWANVGLMDHLQGHFSEAVADFREALKRNPQLFQANFFAGVDLLSQGEPAQALPYLEKARALQAGEPQVLLALGRAWAMQSQPEKANDAYDAASKMDARSAGAWFGLGATWFTMMRRSLEELHTVPDSPWTRALLAQTFEDKGRWDDAIVLRRQLAGESAGPPCSRAAQGLALLGAGQAEQAGEQFRLELAAHPGCWAAPMAPYAERPRKRVACSPMVASCAFEAGDYRAALASANAVLRHRPADQEALYWRVQAASRLSLDALTRAGLVDPGSARVHMMLGEIYREQENFTESREEFVKALAIAPTEPRAHLGMARTCEALGDWDTAIRELQTYLPTAPHDPDAAFMMGRLLVGQARFDDALPFAIAALQVDQPDRPGVHALVAKIYEHQERTEDALRELELALPADDDGSYHYRMSRLLRTLGRNQEAQAALAESKVLHERKSHLAEAAMEKRVGAVLGQ